MDELENNSNPDKKDFAGISNSAKKAAGQHPNPNSEIDPELVKWLTPERIAEGAKWRNPNMTEEEYIAKFKVYFEGAQEIPPNKATDFD